MLPDHPHPPTMGGRVRNLSILRALEPHFDLEIITHVHDRARLADPGPVASLGEWRPVLAWHRRGLLHRALGQIDYRIRGSGWERETWFQGSRSLARAVETALRLRPPALVHTAYWYTLRGLGPRPRPPVWVLDTHDVQFERWERLHGKVSARERDGEVAELRRHDVVVAITPQDARTFGQELGAEARIETIGMGVDLERWSRDRFAPRRKSHSIVYYGNMAAEMNVKAVVHLCEEILPHLRSLRGETDLVILGADPSSEVRKLEALPGVHVTGTVEDPRVILASCGVFALSMRAGSGIRSRACEAMAMHVPVVAYPEALDGMGFVAGEEYRSAGCPREFAEQIHALLEDPSAAESLAVAARRKVSDLYGIEATYHRFVDLYRELIG